MAVVVNNDYTALCKAREELLKFVLRRFVPVSIKSQQSDRIRSLIGNRFLHLPLYEMDPFLRVAGVKQHFPYSLERGIGTSVVGVPAHDFSCSLARVIYIL